MNRKGEWQTGRAPGTDHQLVVGPLSRRQEAEFYLTGPTCFDPCRKVSGSCHSVHKRSSLNCLVRTRHKFDC